MNLEQRRALAERCQALGVAMPSGDDVDLVGQHAVANLRQDFGKLYAKHVGHIIAGGLQWEAQREPYIGPLRFLVRTARERMPPESESPALHAAVARVRAFVAVADEMRRG